MVLIKVQYDAYDRRFKLVDRELMQELKDGEIYTLLVDITLEDLKPTGIADVPAEVEHVMEI
jgi:hypothetical protein